MAGKPRPCSLSSRKTLIQTLLFPTAPPLTLVAQTDDGGGDDDGGGRILVFFLSCFHDSAAFCQIMSRIDTLNTLTYFVAMVT